MSNPQEDYDAAYSHNPGRFEMEAEYNAREDYLAELAAEADDPWAHLEMNDPAFFTPEEIATAALPPPADLDEDIPF